MNISTVFIPLSHRSTEEDAKSLITNTVLLTRQLDKISSAAMIASPSITPIDFPSHAKSNQKSITHYAPRPPTVSRPLSCACRGLTSNGHTQAARLSDLAFTTAPNMIDVENRSIHIFSRLALAAYNIASTILASCGRGSLLGARNTRHATK